MVTYEAFDQRVEVNGRIVRTVVEEGMGKFAAEYRDRAVAALAEEGIESPAPDEWYPQQAWLNAFEAIVADLQPHVLDRLGEQIPEVAPWPNDYGSVPEGLRSTDEAYQRNHRGGDIGYYRFERTGEQAGEVTCYTPYPCLFDRGLIRGVAQKYAPVGGFVYLEETGGTCRRDGDDTCVYTVHW